MQFIRLAERRKESGGRFQSAASHTPLVLFSVEREEPRAKVDLNSYDYHDCSLSRLIRI